MRKDKKQIIGEEISDESIKLFLGVEPADDTPPSLHKLIKAYRGLRIDDFERFLTFFREAGYDLDARDAKGNDFVALVRRETALPAARIQGERTRTANQLRLFAEVLRRGDFHGARIDRARPERKPLPRVDLRQCRIGLGPVAVFGASNFPLAFSTAGGDTAAALAAGCTMVLKPASQTPYSALALAELAERAGIPKGVFSVVTGSAGEVGGELTSNPIVRKLTFTGSTEIGRQLMAECAQDIKKVSLELGGNAPFIVFDDADLDAAVEGALISKYRNNGQTCVCANRLYVQDGVYDAFVDKLKAAVAKLNIGNGLEAGVTTGPLIDAKAVAKVEEHIADAVSKGAKVVSGGKPHALGGTFFEPTILVDVPKNALVSKDETFGPLAPVFRFKDEAEVIAMSNDTEFGLASYFYARDLARVFRVAEQLEYGMVGINTGLISNEVAPFGGIKASGLGREGSKYGIEDYLEIKYLCLGGI